MNSAQARSRKSVVSPQSLEKFSGGPTCVPTFLYPLVDTPK